MDDEDDDGVISGLTLCLINNLFEQMDYVWFTVQKDSDISFISLS